MLIEDQTTKCPHCHCKESLNWESHVKRWKDGREVDEFSFSCWKCSREYLFRDGELKELGVERDPVGAQLAMLRAEMDAFRGRRCLQCGGTLDDWLTCDWCHERYSIESGELVPRAEEAAQPKTSMRDFYAQRPE
jgi:hypothetical protein